MSKVSPIRQQIFKPNGEFSNIFSPYFFRLQVIPWIFFYSSSLEMKIKELESRLELEQATRSRLEVQFNRYKDALDKAQQEASQTKAKEQIAQDSLKKAQKALR